MQMQPLLVKFHTDGAGVVWDTHEPHHLDAILAYRQRIVQGLSMDCDPELPPDETELPLLRWNIGEQWGWHASVLFPVGNTVESVQWARKRFDETRIHLQSSTVINTAAGLCKTTNKPWTLIHALEWHAWCVGDKRLVEALLSGVRALGRERARGRGRVCNIEAIPIETDLSMIHNGRANRYIPSSNGSRKARCRPPYWHMHDRCNVTNVGDLYVEP